VLVDPIKRDGCLPLWQPKQSAVLREGHLLHPEKLVMTLQARSVYYSLVAPVLGHQDNIIAVRGNHHWIPTLSTP